MTRTTQITNLFCPRKKIFDVGGESYRSKVVNTHHDTKRSYILVQNSK